MTEPTDGGTKGRIPADDICPRPDLLPDLSTRPLAPPLYATSVWVCENPDQADELLGGGDAGYVYQRDRHPNADLLAEKCRALEAAEQIMITSSGMSAIVLPALAQLQTGDHVLVSRFLYGRSQQLLTSELARLGITSTLVDPCDLKKVEAAFTERSRMFVVETIANPRLQVVDIGALAELASRHQTQLLVDNTFATPILCRPLEAGADWVMESLTKLMNGHSDVILGMLGGRTRHWERIPLVCSAWGLTSPPFDCWLALRGLATLHLRVERACANGLVAAEFLAGHPAVEQVDYPGLATHPQHALADRQFGGRFGAMVTFRLRGGRPAAESFFRAARSIPFCPSLGEACTTASHPESTSHRGMTEDQRTSLGITGGTIRLSVGIESSDFVRAALAEGLTGGSG